VAALHNAHHGARWERAVPDLERAIERIPVEDWRAAAALANDLGAAEAFAAGLALTSAGAELAARLGLDPRISLEYRMRAEGGSFGAWALHRARTAGSWRERAAVVREVLAPTPSAMRQFFPLARRGRRGLVVAYALRPLRLAIGAVPRAIEYLDTQYRAREKP
jgi:hypothetical protein